MSTGHSSVRLNRFTSPNIRSHPAGHTQRYFSIFFVNALRSVFMPSAAAPYASIDTTTDNTKTMKVFISTKKIEKYLHMCNFCSNFARFYKLFN